MTEEIKFLKLRNGEDLVASVVIENESITLTRPVCIMVENMYEEGRQILNVREWLPPSVVTSESITIDRSEIIATLDISEDFLEQYKDICEMFFDNKPVVKKKAKRVTSGEKVVSIMEALEGMVEKKDKPIH
jgi:hypothetical protein